MSRNIFAFTESPSNTGRTVSYISINDAGDGKVSVSVRSKPRQGEVYGPTAEITLDPHQWLDLLKSSARTLSNDDAQELLTAIVENRG